MDNQIKHSTCERLQADAQLTAPLIITGKHGEAHIFTEQLEANASGMIQVLCDAEFAQNNLIRIMPDVHAGKSCVVGTTMRIRGKVAPALLGGDIGCGITAWRLKLKGKPDLNRLDKVIRTEVPSGMRIHEEPTHYPDAVDELLESLKCARHVQRDKARRSIGTLGGGNHFIELGCENSKDIWLIVHTGSRHLGTEVAEHYQKITFAQRSNQPYDFAYLRDNALADYLHDVQLLQRYAQHNRETILHTILAGMKWKLDGGDDAVIECPHNFIEQSDDEGTILLRKGAIRASAGERIIIPMNMRDGCLLCIGKGNPDWNCSAPHGAGRLMTRTDARNRFTLTRFKQEMQGIFTTCISRETIDESPMAYKPMDEIVNRITPTAEIVSTVKPLYNFKAGGE